eukprot:COSAG01_NODE_1080_length_11819_cov_29.816212_9_plen_336_part_00
MLSKSLFRAAKSRSVSTTTTINRGYKVAVLGAAGGIGQPLALLLKLNPAVTELSCYDVAPVVPGVGVDLDHCSSNSTCKGYGADDLDAALDGCDVVVIPAGVPRKPGMTRDDLFNTNASIVATLTEGVAKNCPDAATLIISNPVNSTVPIASEVLKAHGVYNPKKLFGVTTLDITRARTFVSKMNEVDVYDIDVPVVGGHAGTTIVPLLSQATGTTCDYDEEKRDALVHRIMFGGDEVVQAKDGGGSATLSMAYAGAEFANSVMLGLGGEEQTVCTFVESSVTDAPFFSSKVTLGSEGVQKIHGLGEITEYEQGLVDAMLPDLIAQAEKGFAFGK